MQVDPIGYEDQINLYAYVGNDPMNYTDPTGKRSWAITGSYNLDRRLTEGATVKDVNTVSGRMSAMAGGGAIACIFACQPLVAPLGYASLGSGVTSAATSEDPGSAVPMEILTIGVGKKIDAIGEAIKSMSKVMDELVDSGVKITDKVVSDALKNLSDSTEIDASEIGTSDIESLDTGGSQGSNADNGMSAGNVEICSGMGAQKGGC